QFAALTDGVDSEYLARYGMAGLEGWGDEYIGIDDIFTVMSESIPEPTSLTLLGLTALGLTRRRQ
ncbi:MAG: PEP-CTERM sorting domain-containing protein, partial [Planctomycetota bacterium]